MTLHQILEADITHSKTLDCTAQSSARGCPSASCVCDNGLLLPDFLEGLLLRLRTVGKHFHYVSVLTTFASVHHVFGHHRMRDTSEPKCLDPSQYLVLAEVIIYFTRLVSTILLDAFSCCPSQECGHLGRLDDVRAVSSSEMLNLNPGSLSLQCLRHRNMLFRRNHAIIFTDEIC